jgi:hypothetical protein
LITDVPAARKFTKEMNEVRKDIIAKLESSNEKLAARVNSRRSSPSFQVGEEVLLSTELLHIPDEMKKLQPKFVGPFKVVSVPSAVNVVLELPDRFHNHRRVHVSHVRKYVTDCAYGDRYQPPPSELVGDDEEYEVSKIKGKRVRKGTTEYLVGFKGYDPHEDMWLPKDHLSCPDLVAEYDAKH